MTVQCAIDERCYDLDALLTRPNVSSLGPWNTYRRTKIIKRCAATATEVRPAEDPQTKEFRTLAAQWKRETAIHGSLSRIVMHPAYQRIMAMGPPAIPLILADLKKQPAHWFWALHNLVPPGQDPAEGTTTIRDATNAWLEWGRSTHNLR